LKTVVRTEKFISEFHLLVELVAVVAFVLVLVLVLVVLLVFVLVFPLGFEEAGFVVFFLAEALAAFSN